MLLGHSCLGIAVAHAHQVSVGLGTRVVQVPVVVVLLRVVLDVVLVSLSDSSWRSTSLVEVPFIVVH